MGPRGRANVFHVLNRQFPHFENSWPAPGEALATFFPQLAISLGGELPERVLIVARRDLLGNF